MHTDPSGTTASTNSPESTENIYVTDSAGTTIAINSSQCGNGDAITCRFSSFIYSTSIVLVSLEVKKG